MKDEDRYENEYIKMTFYELEKLGITYFSYGIMAHGNVLNVIFSNEEWGNRYQKNHYERTDPLVQGITHSNLPLIIWDALHPFGKERKVMTERNEICGLKSGLTVGLKNNQITEIIALGAQISPHEFYSLLNEEKYIKEIQNIVKKFYALHKEELQKKAIYS